jgi:hypothetical protein
VFPVAVIYLVRLHQNCDKHLNLKFSLLAAASLAYKFLNDGRTNMKMHAYAGGVSVPDLVKLENAMLCTMDWRLFVSSEEYNLFVDVLDKELADYVWGSTPIPAPLQPCTETYTPMQDVWDEVDSFLGFDLQPFDAQSFRSDSAPQCTSIRLSPTTFSQSSSPHCLPEWNYPSWAALAPSASSSSNATAQSGLGHVHVPADWGMCDTFINPSSVDIASWALAFNLRS